MVAWASVVIIVGLTLALVILGCRRHGHGYMFLAGLAVAGVAFTHYITFFILPPLFILAVFVSHYAEKAYPSLAPGSVLPPPRTR